jgi:hypothetical protein
MDGDCGSVSMDRYWNNVGTPFFFVVLGFGLFVLFSMNNIQLASNQHIFNVVAGVLRSGPPSKVRKPPAPEPAPEPAPAARPKAAAQRELPGAAAPQMPASPSNRQANQAEQGQSIGMMGQTGVASRRPNTGENNSPV